MNFRPIFLTVFVFFLSISTSIADTFDARSNKLIQKALATLGYSVGTPDGIWGGNTRRAVSQYRFDFGMANSQSLTVAEANELLERANDLNDEITLTLTPNRRHYSYDGSESKASLFESNYFQPEYLLHGSERSALAYDLASAFNMSAGKVDYSTAQSWLADKKVRAQLWFESDLDRLKKDGWPLSASLTQVHLALSEVSRPMSREIALNLVLPDLRYLYEYRVSTSKKKTYDALTDTIMFGAFGVLRGAGCNGESLLEREDIDFFKGVFARYEEAHPKALEVQAGKLALAQCLLAQEASDFLIGRFEFAKSFGDPFVLVSAAGELARHEAKAGDTDFAKELFHEVSVSLPEAERQKFLARNAHIMATLGMNDLLGPYYLSQVAEVSSGSRSSRVEMSSTLSLASNLAEIGFGFSEIDPLFTSVPRNQWLEGDIHDYRNLFLRYLYSIDSFREIERLAPHAVEDALAVGRENVAKELLAWQIETALRVGSFEDGEKILVHYLLLPQSDSDAQLTRDWLSRLNLAKGEGISPGRAYAEGLSKFVHEICKPQRRDGSWNYKPTIERETVLADPTFLQIAKVQQLPEQIAKCKGDEYVKETLDRIGCYLWATLDQMSPLNTRMDAWFAKAEEPHATSDSVVTNFEGMGCVMGIAEAGRMDLIQSYAAKVPSGHQATATWLLRMAADRSSEYAEVVEQSMGDRRTGLYDPNYIGIEIAGRLGRPERAALRASGLLTLQSIHSGAAMDSVEEDRIDAMALDLGMGYHALGLDEVALTFLEAKDHVFGTRLSPAKALALISDSNDTRFVLAKSRMHLDRGEIDQADALLSPFVETLIARAFENGLGSAEEFGQWSNRLAGLLQAYLSLKIYNPNAMNADDIENTLAAQQLLMAAHSMSSAGRLTARLEGVDQDLVRAFQDDQKALRRILMTQGTPQAIAEAQEKVDASLATLEKADPNYFETQGKLILTSDEAFKASDGAPVIVLTSLPEKQIATTITKKGAEVRVLELGARKLRDKIDLLREDIQAERPLSHLTELSEFVLGNLVIKKTPRLLVVVEGAFAALPIGVLAPPAERSEMPLGALSAVSIAPSVASIVTDRSNVSNVERKPFLGIGDSIYNAASAEERLGFVPVPLRETSAELRFMGAVLDADPEKDILLGHGAKEEVIQKLSESGSLASYDLLAFATHGFLGSEGKLTEPGLLLSEAPPGSQSDGFLSASEIEKLKLDARLVILSACDTGAIAGSDRGLSRLTQAFTYAGARSLIVTHWPIDSVAAVEISRRMALSLRDDPDIRSAEALRRAVHDLLSNPETTRFTAPRYWASHAVVGNG